MITGIGIPKAHSKMGRIIRLRARLTPYGKRWDRCPVPAATFTRHEALPGSSNHVYLRRSLVGSSGNSGGTRAYGQMVQSRWPVLPSRTSAAPSAGRWRRTSNQSTLVYRILEFEERLNRPET